MGLPDRKGMLVCEELRKNGVLTPILILSGDTNKKTVIHGLRTGADDYLEKPFYRVELLERLNAIIRRNRRAFPTSLLTFKDLRLDTQNHTLEANQKPLKLTLNEMAVMRCLMQYAPKIVGRDDMFKRVWGISKDHTSNRLDVYVKRLRGKLGQLDTGITIQTVYGKGYQLK
jgi:DNA-binding response OmpR family regulator